MEEGLRLYKNTPGAILLDVRSPGEYKLGRIAGSVNFPIQQLPTIGEMIEDKEKPIFVYCLSGARSNRAAAFLKKIGYVNVTNIGGLKDYQGPLEK